MPIENGDADIGRRSPLKVKGLAHMDGKGVPYSSDLRTMGLGSDGVYTVRLSPEDPQQPGGGKERTISPQDQELAQAHDVVRRALQGQLAPLTEAVLLHPVNVPNLSKDSVSEREISEEDRPKYIRGMVLIRVMAEDIVERKFPEDQFNESSAAMTWRSFIQLLTTGVVGGASAVVHKYVTEGILEVDSRMLESVIEYEGRELIKTLATHQDIDVVVEGLIQRIQTRLEKPESA